MAVDAAELGYLEGHQGGRHTGDNGGVVHHTHTDHLHGEDGCRQRRAKQGGEGGGHAAHDHHPAVLLVQPYLPAHKSGQGAAQLESCPLSAGRSPHKVRDDGG